MLSSLVWGAASVAWSENAIFFQTHRGLVPRLEGNEHTHVRAQSGSGSSFKKSDCSVTNESLLRTSASCYAPVSGGGGGGRGVLDGEKSVPLRQIPTLLCTFWTISGLVAVPFPKEQRCQTKRKCLACRGSCDSRRFHRSTPPTHTPSRPPPLGPNEPEGENENLFNWDIRHHLQHVVSWVHLFMELLLSARLGFNM